MTESHRVKHKRHAVPPVIFLYFSGFWRNLVCRLNDLELWNKRLCRLPQTNHSYLLYHHSCLYLILCRPSLHRLLDKQVRLTLRVSNIKSQPFCCAQKVNLVRYDARKGIWWSLADTQCGLSWALTVGREIQRRWETTHRFWIRNGWRRVRAFRTNFFRLNEKT